MKLNWTEWCSLNPDGSSSHKPFLCKWLHVDGLDEVIIEVSLERRPAVFKADLLDDTSVVLFLSEVISYQDLKE